MNTIIYIYITCLFILATPNFLFPYSKTTLYHYFIHAIIFTLLVNLTYDLVNRLVERNLEYGVHIKAASNLEKIEDPSSIPSHQYPLRENWYGMPNIKLPLLNPPLYYFNDASISRGKTSIEPTFYYKPDFPNMSDHEFILKCKQRLMKNKSIEKAFKLVYEDDDRKNIKLAVFKSDISKPFDSGGVKSRVLVFTLYYAEDIGNGLYRNGIERGNPSVTHNYLEYSGQTPTR